MDLVESSRAYDPAGRMVSITDSMGNATLYGYTDNGLVAQILRASPSGQEFVEQQNTYDAAGNLTTRVTNNLATTTNYTVDAADRVTSQTLDPSGLDRVTNLTYSPDDQVITQSLSGPACTPARVDGLHLRRPGQHDLAKRARRQRRAGTGGVVAADRRDGHHGRVRPDDRGRRLGQR